MVNDSGIPFKEAEHKKESMEYWNILLQCIKEWRILYGKDRKGSPTPFSKIAEDLEKAGVSFDKVQGSASAPPMSQSNAPPKPAMGTPGGANPSASAVPQKKKSIVDIFSNP